MKVIAKRTNALIWVFGIGFVGFIVELLFDYENFYLIGKVFLALMILVFGILLVYQIKRPKDIISLNKANGTLYLHLYNRSIKISSLKSVIFERSYSKGGINSWGKLILKTVGNEYEYNYVENVEKVAYDLNRLISIEKIKNEE